MIVRSPLKRIGGKSASASRIVAAFPPAESYKRYCEPCGGAAHVFLAKPAYVSHEEIFNDLDGNLIAFWMEMLENGAKLQAWLEQMPYSHELYNQYYKSLFDGSDLSQFERAWKYFYCLRQTGTGWLRRSRVGWDCRGNNVRSFRGALDLFNEVQERLKYAVIDNRDVLTAIKRYDAPDTLFYIDPPYFEAEAYYEASRYGFPHEQMAAQLNEAKGLVAVSYYPHPEIDRLYPLSKWRRTSWEQPKSSDIQSRLQATATELLLCNYPESESLWDSLEP